MSSHSQTVDRGEAVNLARSLVGSCELTSTLTDHGVRTLANAVLLMDAALRAQQDGPADRDAVLEEVRSWASAMYMDSRKHRHDIMFQQGWEAASEAIEDKIRDLKNTAPQSAGADDGWIPVSERLPVGDDDVLAFDVRGKVHGKSAHNVRTAWHMAVAEKDTCFYTHWKPLPTGPSPAATDRREG